MPLLIVSPKRVGDFRGWFSETWNAQRYEEAGIACNFCQDNESHSGRKGTLRGLHFQVAPFAQSKLVRCVKGRIFDVVVDVRRASPTFGKWAGMELSSETGLQLFIPPGYAHGFVTLEDDCIVGYKVDAYHSPPHEAGLAWNDPALGICWPLAVAPILSDRDANFPTLGELTVDCHYDGVPLEPPGELAL